MEFQDLSNIVHEMEPHVRLRPELEAMEANDVEPSAPAPPSALIMAQPQSACDEPQSKLSVGNRNVVLIFLLV